ncbi:pyrroline-5-carboxylate reductase family protein [Sphingomonas canadensis]|uniref:Pyrroline-5-carboxylate reductase n=1 Tax=Sphingomonas canadensis TaxID=1219257 RepID=A0ABW3H818_9SPHN|nr:pyrroline-5-carboxylate reductase dimerization domain-containing protein [Sphingomonas canadensis]MCW3837023.1 NAD(P)-binding domain-containing protein [Sphingomonas canadensis]
MSISAPGSIWLVGCGNMGAAMLRRWIAAGIDPASVTAIDPYTAAVPDGVTLLRQAPADGAPDVLVLAIKPQQLGAMPPLGGPGTLLISILAGVEEATLAARFPVRAVVRAMPNLPVSIGKGVVALHGAQADAAARATADLLMAPLGRVEWLADEGLFHIVTALSGSGPGFVYRFIDALAQAGTALGLPEDQALRFAIATVEGAAALADGAGAGPAELADRVASPGGTTRAGLDVLDRDAGLMRLVRETLDAAARRSAELAEAARNA